MDRDRLVPAMRGVPVVAVALVLASLISLGDDRSSAQAHGCTYLPPDDPNERLNLAIERSELVLVGIVIDERPAPREGNVSTVKPEAVLKGQAAGDLEFPYLHEVWACIGGPRLFVGNRYLLSIRLEPDPDGIGPAGRFWQTQLAGGQVLLENGNAYMDDYKAQSDARHDERSPHIGRGDDVVHYVAARIGSPPQETASASAAAVRSDENMEWSTTLLVLLSISTVALVGLTAAFARNRILAPRRPSLPPDD
jgi:hypothetical protein